MSSPSAISDEGGLRKISGSDGGWLPSSRVLQVIRPTHTIFDGQHGGSSRTWERGSEAPRGPFQGGLQTHVPVQLV